LLRWLAFRGSPPGNRALPDITVRTAYCRPVGATGTRDLGLGFALVNLPSGVPPSLEEREDDNNSESEHHNSTAADGRAIPWAEIGSA
jgi:hypothetical protein